MAEGGQGEVAAQAQDRLILRGTKRPSKVEAAARFEMPCCAL
jgi:hypothetical protein